jgi:hypothetical protein
MIKQKENVYGSAIKFYCKDCQKIVDAKQVGRKNVFRCAICKTKNVAFGTEKSIKNFFHIEDDEAGDSEEAKKE